MQIKDQTGRWVFFSLRVTTQHVHSSTQQAAPSSNIGIKWKHQSRAENGVVFRSAKFHVTLIRLKFQFVPSSVPEGACQQARLHFFIQTLNTRTLINKRCSGSDKDLIICAGAHVFMSLIAYWVFRIDLSRKAQFFPDGWGSFSNIPRQIFTLCYADYFTNEWFRVLYCGETRGPEWRRPINAWLKGAGVRGLMFGNKLLMCLSGRRRGMGTYEASHPIKHRHFLQCKCSLHMAPVTNHPAPSGQLCLYVRMSKNNNNLKRKPRSSTHEE